MRNEINRPGPVPDDPRPPISNELPSGEPQPISDPTTLPEEYVEIPPMPALLVDRVVKNDSLQGYRRAITDAPTLSKAQGVNLARRIEAAKAAQSEYERLVQDGAASPDEQQALEALKEQMADGARARDYMIFCHLKLAFGEAMRLSNIDVPATDLVSIANVGLLQALESFDYRKGVKFSTHATWTVWAFVQRESYRVRGVVYVPEGIWDEARKIKKIQDELGEDATTSQVASAYGLPPDAVQMILAATSNHVLLRSDFKIARDAEPISNVDRRIDVMRAIGQLTDREAGYVTMAFGLNNQPERKKPEIAKILGAGVSTVTLIRKSAFEKLKDSGLDEDHEV